MRIRNYIPMATAIALAAALSLFAASVAVDRIEAGSRAELSRAMAEAGHDWASVRVDGLQVVLTGTAPDEAARFSAISAAGTVIDATRIIDRMDVRPAQRIEAPEFKIEILRNLDGISLIGLIPAETDRSALLDRLGRITDAAVTDLLEEGHYPAPAGWDATVTFALDALMRIPRSKVSMTADRVSLTGIVDSEQIRRQVETELARNVPTGVELRLDISAPRPVIAPYTVRFVIDGDTRRFDACAAETAEARDAILSAAREAGLTGRAVCQIGLGSPSVQWAAAVSDGIRALDRLGAGSITFSDADVSLVAPYTVTPAEFDRQVGVLERSLPDGFSLTAVRTPPPETESEEETGDEGVAEFRAVLNPETGVELLGRLPDERSRATVESYAHAHFGRAATEAATRLDDGLPDGWSLRVLTALDALSYLAEGQVVMRPDSLSVSGRTGREDAPSVIARLLSERLGSGAEYQIDVAYEETLDPDSGLPTPDECVTMLNAVLAERQITFEPGSATVDAEGLRIIDRLSDILKDCQSVRMEIAGHTDSQGRESMNMRLSQERANAVLNALMARRVLTSNLSARGYGETTPIADNATEEGREANRRIEFTLIEEDAAGDGDQPSEEAAETTDGETDEQN